MKPIEFLIFWITVSISIVVTIILAQFVKAFVWSAEKILQTKYFLRLLTQAAWWPFWKQFTCLYLWQYQHFLKFQHGKNQCYVMLVWSSIFYSYNFFLQCVYDTWECVCVCLGVCVCVCMHACVHMYMSACMLVHICLCLYIYLCRYISTQSKLLHFAGKVNNN